MIARLLMRLIAAVASLITVAGLAYVYADPPASMQLTRDGVPHHAPPVANPAGGEPLSLHELVRHFKGGRR